MKTDTYTKAVLTVIAACLCIIAFRETNLVPTLKAAPTWSGNGFTSVPLNPDGSINVKVTNYETMKVEIDRVNCTVPVELKEVRSGAFYSCVVPIKAASSDPINIKVKEVASDAFYSCTVPVKQSSSDPFNVKIKEVAQDAFYYCTVPVKNK